MGSWSQRVHNGKKCYDNSLTKASTWDKPAGDSEDVKILVNGLASMQLLATSDVSLVSHAHGRQRRDERSISRRELQEAVKHGLKERANPGRLGETRWRYTHSGIVYITDESSRHEVTSWREASDMEHQGSPMRQPPAMRGAVAGAAAMLNSHVVVVVDGSASMNKRDVPGSRSSRISAVYECLATDLVDLELAQGGDGGGMVVSIIEFSDVARTLCDRLPLDASLSARLTRRASLAKGFSHGMYLPALDAALELLERDAADRSQLFLIFLSDGAPSDTHLEKQALVSSCVRRVERMGWLLGKDRFFIGTVAFGPSSGDYVVLQRMAEALPRSSFQKLGLSINCLRTAFSSLASSLATMRTEVAGPRGTQPAGSPSHRPPAFSPRAAPGGGLSERIKDCRVIQNDAWDIYGGEKLYSKRAYIKEKMGYVSLSPPPCPSGLPANWTHGVAFTKKRFAEGAERTVFQFSEVFSNDNMTVAVCVGSRMVAKEAKLHRDSYNAEFHPRFCRSAAQAEELACIFNKRVMGGPSVQVHFLQCAIYEVVDTRYKGGLAPVIVEQELEGPWLKWNDNKGGVDRAGGGGMPGIAEGIEEEEEEESVSVADVPQCFSHFTHAASEGMKLVCDLQGVWNSTDGFTLTDPVVHHSQSSSRTRHNGATDKGMDGIRLFFATHVCNVLCRQLGLDWD